jgi:uncharacterized protein (DUF58 family)
MLYPDFNELVALKDLKLDLTQSSSSSSHATILGGQHSPFRGQGLEFDSVRKYVAGDDIRNIDWRVTARTDSPHLKIFKEERERHVLLCVDLNEAMRFGTKKTFKSVQAAHIAALLGWRAMANQDRISACLYGDVAGGIGFFAPSRTRKAFSTMLKSLSEPSAERHAISLSSVFQHISQVAHTGSLVYFISDFMEITKEFQEEVKIYRLAKRCDVVFIAVNDPADMSIYPSGLLAFSSAGEKIHVNTDSVSGREAYEQQWKENREKLYAMTSGLKIPLIELTTESVIRRDLVLGLKGLAKRKTR